MSEQPADLGLKDAWAVLRTGWQQMPQLRSGLRLTIMLGLVGTAATLISPLVLQQAIDRTGLTSDSVDTGAVLRLVIGAVALVIFAATTGWVVRARLIKNAEDALTDLRVRGFAHVHELSLATHNEQRTGVLIAHVTSDITALSRFSEWGLLVWATQPVVVAGIFIVMAIWSWPLALLSMVLFGPAAPALRWFQGRMNRAHAEIRRSVGAMLGVWTEALNGAETIRAAGAEAAVLERMRDSSEHRYGTAIKANRFQASVFVVGDMLGTIVLVIVLTAGLLWRDSLGLSAGELVGMLYLTTLLNTPIGEMGETLDETQRAIAGLRNVLNLLEVPIDVPEPEHGQSMPSGPLSISLRDVTFAYDADTIALRDVSVDLPAGSQIAVVGATGSGKSTFARLLCRLADPSDGELRIGDAVLRDVDPASRLRSIRFVPQDGFLFDVSLRDNIAYGRAGATDQDIAAAVNTLGLESWVDTLPEGLDSPVGERGSLLSVGERQLVAFARAAVADPGLLILDEATASVDPDTDRRLTEALGRLAENRTIVSVAHRLATAEAADIVLVFDGGRLVEMGNHDELVTRDGVYSRLHAAWSLTSAVRSSPPVR